MHNRTPVKSSAFASVGYVPETKMMQVEMRGTGKVYDYPDFSEDEHKAFMAAESMGKHFALHIRPKYAKKK